MNECIRLVKMGEYVKRADVYKNVMEAPAYPGALADAVMSAPAVNIRPAVYGKWIPVDELNNAYRCSECMAVAQKECSFCPRCGAEMVTEDVLK